MGRLKFFWGLVKDTVWRWFNDDVFSLGAALAYYTIFSMAPIVVIVVAVAGMVFGEEAARGHLVSELSDTLGPNVGHAIADIARHVYATGSGVLATVISVIVLLIGATSVFGELQQALNHVWGVEAEATGGVWGFFKTRLLSFAVVLGIGFLLIVSLVISALLAAAGAFLTSGSLPGGVWLWQGLHWLLSVGVFTLLFALIFKILPDVRIAWGDVWIGSAVTALLFSLGKYLIGLYLGQASWISAYGAAGSLVVILLWVYYSALLVLLGAEFTRVYADRLGRAFIPARNARPVTEEAKRAAAAHERQAGVQAAGDGRDGRTRQAAV